MKPKHCIRTLALGALPVFAACQGEAEAGAGAGPGSVDGAVVATSLPNPFPHMARPWGRLADGLEWGQVSAIDLDNDGRHVRVADRCGATNCLGSDRRVVMKVDPNGEIVTSFGAEMFVRPHGVFVDADNNVWVTDHRNASAEQLQQFPDAVGRGQQVFKFSPAGEVLLTLGTAGEAGDPPERLDNPTDVVVGPDGRIYVSEGHSNTGPPGRISIFASDGTYLRSFGTFGTGPGQFRTPHGLAFDSRGRLFVADRGNSRVQVFDQNGTFLEEMRQFGRPNDVFIDANDRLFTLDSESGPEENPGYSRGIYIGDAGTGELTGFIPPLPMEGRPEGTTGEGVVVDAEGTLYVAEVSLRGLTRFGPE